MNQRKIIKLSLLDKRILNRLQEDIPFVERPWEAVARELNTEEDFILERIAFFKKKGIIRRISAIFAPRKIGFASTLVAAKIASGNIEKAVKRINSYPEVTHNYRRESEFNLWFTLVAKNRNRIAQIINGLKKNKNIKRILEFPAEKLFKIDVKFRA